MGSARPARRVSGPVSMRRLIAQDVVLHGGGSVLESFGMIAGLVACGVVALSRPIAQSIPGRDHRRGSFSARPRTT